MDDRDLGNATQFMVKLTPGAHRVVVRHPCCAEEMQVIQVSPRRAVYPLRYGKPRNAEFNVLNAPPGARLLVNGNFIGPASAPPTFEMKSPDQKVTVTIGDRTLETTLKAGMINVLDYAKGTP